MTRATDASMGLNRPGLWWRLGCLVSQPRLGVDSVAPMVGAGSVSSLTAALWRRTSVASDARGLRTRRAGRRRGSCGGVRCCASGPSRAWPARRRRRSATVALAGSADQLGLVEPVDGLGERVVVAVADVPIDGRGAELGEAFAVADTGELAAGIGVADASPSRRVPRDQRAISKASRTIVGAHVRSDPPADDHAAERVDDETHVGDPGPRRHVGQVGDPQLVRALRGEVAADQVRVAAARCRRAGWCATVGRGARRGCPAHASAGRPGHGRCRDRHGGPPSTACGPRRPGSSPSTTPPGSGSAPRHASPAADGGRDLAA